MMWSFPRDGEADERLKGDFQRHVDIDEQDKRAKRKYLTAPSVSSPAAAP
jgi:hypothetical protein